MKIILDPGHGGTDIGAVGFGLLEKDLNIILAQKLAGKLKALGYEVDSSLINNINYSSTELTDLIKASGAALCLSCHSNAFNGQARGMEIIHSIHSDARLAQLILDEVAKTGFPVRKAYSRESTSYPGNDFYFVIRQTYPDVETIIIEFGFIDNAEDYNILTNSSWQDKLTESIATAVMQYIPITPIKDKTPILGFPTFSRGQMKRALSANNPESDSSAELYPVGDTGSNTDDGDQQTNEHWAKSCNDELLLAGLLFSDHSSSLDNAATEGMVICLINRLRKEFLNNG